MKRWGWSRTWHGVAGICACLWLAACTSLPGALTPDAPLDADASYVVSMPIVAVAYEGNAAVVGAAPVAAKATGDPLLSQLRRSLLASPTATVAPTATVRPSATPEPSPTPCVAPGTMVQGVFENSYAPPLSYRVYLPPCYGEDAQTYPVLYMLPGNIYTDSIWDDLGLDEAAEQAIRGGHFPPFLIVMVAGGYLADNTSGGPGSYEDLFLEEFVPFIEAQYCAWPASEGRAIGGMSRGGYWALEIAFRHPEQFASVGGHSAALLDNYGGQAINPEDTGLTNELGDLRVYLDIGENDWVISNVQRLHERMEAAGIAHEWVLQEGRHEEAYWAAHVNDYLTFYAAAWPEEAGEYPLCSPAKEPLVSETS